MDIQIRINIINKYKYLLSANYISIAYNKLFYIIDIKAYFLLILIFFSYIYLY